MSWPCLTISSLPKVRGGKPDPNGEHLPGLESARTLALETARELIRDEELDWAEWSFRITDESGRTLLVLPFLDAVVKH